MRTRLLSLRNTLVLQLCSLCALAACERNGRDAGAATHSAATGAVGSNNATSASSGNVGSTVTTGSETGGSETGGSETGGSEAATSGGGEAPIGPGGGQAGDEASGTATSTAAGTTSSGSCDPIPCPELGSCTANLQGGQCARTCVFSEEYSMSSAEDVARLASFQCTVFQGSLSATGSEISDFSGLESILAINGSLRIEAASELSSLDALSGLVTISEHLVLSDLPKLGAIELPALEQVRGSLSITSVSAPQIRMEGLKSVGVSLSINANQALTSIEMNSLQRVPKLLVGLNSVLETLHGLPALVELQTMQMAHNPKLPQCEVDAIASRADLCDPCDQNDPNGTCE